MKKHCVAYVHKKNVLLACDRSQEYLIFEIVVVALRMSVGSHLLQSFPMWYFPFWEA